jgi:hypothetical protein
MKQESHQFDISLSLTNEEESGFTLSRFTTGIGQPRTFECQLLPIAKGANSLKMELFHAVAHLEPGLAEPVSHDAGLCISTRIQLSWDPFQQLLKEAVIYSSW